MTLRSSSADYRQCQRTVTWKVLSYELRKTNKSDLAKKLEANADEIFAIPRQDRLISSQSSAYFIVGMAMCQALNENHFKTFDELGNVVLKRAVSF